MREEKNLNNYGRILMELGFDIKNKEPIVIYAEEVGLDIEEDYKPDNLLQVQKVVLKVLEGISNNTDLMKNYKTEDISVTHFYTNLLKRIDDLRLKIRELESKEEISINDGGIFYLF